MNFSILFLSHSLLLFLSCSLPLNLLSLFHLLLFFLSFSLLLLTSNSFTIHLDTNSNKFLFRRQKRKNGERRERRKRTERRKRRESEKEEEERREGSFSKSKVVAFKKSSSVETKDVVEENVSFALCSILFARIVDSVNRNLSTILQVQNKESNPNEHTNYHYH